MSLQLETSITLAFNLLYISLGWLVLFTATLLRDGSYTLEDRPMYQTPCSSHLHFHKLVWLKAKQLIWNFHTQLKEIPVALCLVVTVNGDLRGAFSKLLIITETKEILGKHLLRRFSRNHQHHHCCYGQNKIYTYFTKQIFTSPNLGWELEINLFAI